MTFEQAIDRATKALDTAESQASPDLAATYLTASNTWVRIAEILHNRDRAGHEQ